MKTKAYKNNLWNEMARQELIGQAIMETNPLAGLHYITAIPVRADISVTAAMNAAGIPVEKMDG